MGHPDLLSIDEPGAIGSGSLQQDDSAGGAA